MTKLVRSYRDKQGRLVFVFSMPVNSRLAKKILKQKKTE